ncbi:hypothetical protein P8452_75804 [Trifolium repens]|nr:hypothetical protein P8452_75804 [Trifolium repens]
MAFRTGNTKLSFEVLRRTSPVEQDSLLHRSKSDPITQPDRKKCKHKRKKKLLDLVDSTADSTDPNHKTQLPLQNGCNGFELDSMRYCGNGGSVVYKEPTEAIVCAVTAALETVAACPTSVRGGVEGFNFGKLRQRNVSFGSCEDIVASLVGDDGGIGKENEIGRRM